MSRSKRKSQEKHIQGKFVALPHWMAETPAWKSLSLVARCVWFELMRRWKGPYGSNNGDLYLTTREVEDLLHVGKSTAARAFHQLRDRGFIRMTKPAGLEWRNGQRHQTAPRYAATHEPVGRAPATKDFLRWS
jgi:hypothetical protein